MFINLKQQSKNSKTFQSFVGLFMGVETAKLNDVGFHTSSILSHMLL